MVLTDGGPPPLLQLISANIEHSQKVLAPGAVVQALPLRWGDVAATDTLLSTTTFDWVFAADVLYDHDATPALCDTLASLMTRLSPAASCPPRCIIAQEHGSPLPDAEDGGESSWFRDEHLVIFQEAAAARGLDVSVLTPTEGNGLAASEARWKMDAFSEPALFLIEVTPSDKLASCSVHSPAVD